VTVSKLERSSNDREDRFEHIAVIEKGKTPYWRLFSISLN